MSPGDVRYEVVLGDELPAEALTWADKMLAESPFAPRVLKSLSQRRHRVDRVEGVDRSEHDSRQRLGLVAGGPGRPYAGMQGLQGLATHRARTVGHR